MDSILAVCVWLFGIIIGAIIAVLAAEPAQRFAVRLLSPLIPGPSRSLRGIWESEYEYSSDGENCVERQLVEIRQFGRAVFGFSFKSQRHDHRLRAKFRQGLFLTGTWENTKPGKVYHGAAQFVFDPSGGVLKGKYVGFSDQLHRIEVGEWTMTLVTKHVDSKARLKAKRDFRAAADDS